MALALQSFGKSSLGAFVKSPLGARDNTPGGLLWYAYADRWRYSTKATPVTFDSDTIGGRIVWQGCINDSYIFTRSSGYVYRTPRDETMGASSSIVLSGLGSYGSMVRRSGSRLFVITAGSGAGASVVFYYSDDNGDTWTPVTMFTGVYLISAYAYPVRLGNGTLVAYVRDYIFGDPSPYKHYILYSLNNGLSWAAVLLYTTVSGSSFSLGLFIVGGYVYFMGDYNDKSLYRSVDGISWAFVGSHSTTWTFDTRETFFIGFPDGSVLVFRPISNSFYIAKSTDGGLTWAQVKDGIIGAFKDIQIYGNIIFALPDAAANRKIRYSTDYGASWQDFWGDFSAKPTQLLRYGARYW